MPLLSGLPESQKSISFAPQLWLWASWAIRTVRPRRHAAQSRTKRDKEKGTSMQPDLEIVEVRGDESFTAWAHGYPYRTVRWHFHPEYEIQLIVETRGVYFVGDHVGHFEPGNLVLMGPDLPHNWFSVVRAGQSGDRRGIW